MALKLLRKLRGMRSSTALASSRTPQIGQHGSHQFMAGPTPTQPNKLMQGLKRCIELSRAQLNERGP